MLSYAALSLRRGFYLLKKDKMHSLKLFNLKIQEMTKLWSKRLVDNS